MLKTLKYLALILLLMGLIVLSPILYQTFVFFNTDFISSPAKEQSLIRSKVYLIGSRHQPTKSYNADTLYQLLERIQPDIVLLEWDASFFINNRVKWRYRQVIPSSYKNINNLEILAATKYAKTHEQAILAPFEWDSTTMIYQKVSGKPRADMMRALLNTKSDTSHQVLKECGGLRSYAMSLNNLSAFNSDVNDSLMERFIKLEYVAIPSLILANDSLAAYHATAKTFQDYWPVRNTRMSENILQIIKEYPKRRIVVLTGFRHRYFLRKYLSSHSADDDFELLDYQEKVLNTH